jgi:hypothetical protein
MSHTIIHQSPRRGGGNINDLYSGGGASIQDFFQPASGGNINDWSPSGGGGNINDYYGLSRGAQGAGGGGFDLNELIGDFGSTVRDYSQRQFDTRDAARSGYSGVQQAIADARRRQIQDYMNRLKGQGGGGGGGASAIINKRLARARDELAKGNEEFDDYFEAISPGFDEAVDQAKRIAEAEAAIEGHFEGTKEAIDARYADAEGAVRAIADSQGNENAALSEAIHNSIYEFKEFIDQDLHTEKEGAQKLNAAASALAQAAAESASAGARGGGARDQFTFQKKYEKIIQNLLDQRAAAGAAASRGRANAKAQILNQLRSFSQSTPYSRADMDWFVRGQMLKESNVPASQTMRILEMQDSMQQTGMTKVRDYWDYIASTQQGGVLPPGLDALRRQMGDWTEVIEVGVSNISRIEIDRLYNETFEAPQTDFDFFNQGRQQAFQGGLQGDEAAQFGNFFLGEQRGFNVDELQGFEGFDLQQILAGL